MKIHRTVLVCVALIGLTTGLLGAEEPADIKPGLVAHYFKDPDNWKGIWPESSNVPHGRPIDWTFRKYAYSRVEPLINHRFIRRGWFSIRWKGYFDPKAPLTQAIGGKINLNPNNSSANEFTMVLKDGRKITRDDLNKDYAGYSGVAVSGHVKPKGNGNQNSLTVAGEPYPLVNANTYDITGAALNVKLYNDRVTKRGKAMGKWWLEIEADAANIVAGGDGSGGGGGTDGGQVGGNEHEYFFEVFADDGCRLWIDGQELINDWRACWEETPGAHRKTRGIKLANGKHEIVVEYFQGLSLTADEDQDPIVLKWRCPSRGIRDQVIPAGHFSHGDLHMKSWKR
jgi:hypothetical protein